MSRATFGNEEVAARIALRNSVYTEGIGKGFLEELADDLLDALVNGNQVKIANLFTCHISSFLIFQFLDRPKNRLDANA